MNEHVHPGYAGGRDDDGEFAELDALYQAWVSGLVRWLQRQLKFSGGLAEDIAQDAFLIMWRRWPDIRNHPNLRAYLYKTARHLMWDVAGERSRVLLQAESPDEAWSDWEERSASYHEGMAIRKALEELPPRQREAVWLYYFCGFKQKEIAEIMQIQRDTVGALLFQARKGLAGLLGPSD